MKIITTILNRTIEYSFYLIFFLVPLFFLTTTSEYFELNKIWLLYILTTIIAASWIINMIIEKKVIFRKTPLDLPILLFLASQIISTVFPVDRHISFWGNYVRFNGGLLSIISYLVLYYAFVSNLGAKQVTKILVLSLISGIGVALWGLPSHFGFDPVCWIFRGTLDTQCWKGDFHPSVRMFSTLGQPTWLAAYLDILLPLSMAYMLIKRVENADRGKVAYFLISVLFYISLIFTNARAGMLAFYLTNAIFWGILFLKRIFIFKVLLRYFLAINIAFLSCSFFLGSPIGASNNFSFASLKNNLTVYAQTKTPEISEDYASKLMGITNSWELRKLVWRAALDAWIAHPIFGTGTETFAYAFARYMPPEYSLTSEMDKLPQKAHNEYLNYLSTTGLLGLGTYLLFIAMFLFVMVKYLFGRGDIEGQYLKSRGQKLPPSGKAYEPYTRFILATALFCCFLSILATNFFSFSTVTTNLYFFFIPVFIFFMQNILGTEKQPGPAYLQNKRFSVGWVQLTMIGCTVIVSLFILFRIFRYWYADSAYAKGRSFDQTHQKQDYQKGYQYLVEAVELEPDEPVYRNELVSNLGALADTLFLQKDVSKARKIVTVINNSSNHIIDNHPENMVYWYNRFNVFNLLASRDKQYQDKYYVIAQDALENVIKLSPNDPKAYYDLGQLLEKTGKANEAIKAYEEAIKFKPDYIIAYDALGKLYHRLATGQTISNSSSTASETIIDPKWQQKSIETYRKLLTSPYYRIMLQKQGKPNR